MTDDSTRTTPNTRTGTARTDTLASPETCPGARRERKAWRKQ